MTSAADKLGMTASAVSQHIRQLEQSLGVTLLHRSTRKLTLSEAETAFYPGTAAMISAVREAEEGLQILRESAGRRSKDHRATGIKSRAAE